MSSYDYTRDEKKGVLSRLILEAWTEQFSEARMPKRVPDYDPFEVRAFRTERIDRVIDVLKNTDALELLAEMVGVIEEEEA